MIILLDENFPLRLYTRLQKEGLAAQHILLTDRGIQDKQIIARLMQEEVLFLTQDENFVEAAPDCKAGIIWSRISQCSPGRTEICPSAAGARRRLCSATVTESC